MMVSEDGTEEAFLNKVVPPLKKGIVNFRDLSDILLKCDENHSMSLQQVIERTLHSFQQSEAAASQQLAMVDEYYIQLTCKKGSLEAEGARLKSELENLSSHLKAIKDSLQDYSQALDRANCDMRSSQADLDECRDKARQNEAIRNAGIGIMFIPIIGLIAGSVMVGVGQAELDQANWKAQKAQEEVDRYRNLVNNFTAQLNVKNQEKTEITDKIYECENHIWQTEVSLREMKSKREYIANVQQKLRSLVHFLTVLAGRTDVARVVTCQSCIHLGPLCNVLTEIVGLLYQAPGRIRDQLLQDSDIQTSIKSLQDVSKQVLAITGSQPGDQF